MRCLLLAVMVVGVGVAARAPTDLGPVGYHARVGIPLAAAIRAAEEKAQASRIFNGTPAALGQFPNYPITANQFVAHISVPVLSNAQCALQYGSLVTDRILCTDAGAGNTNVCSSDSGGPITVGNVLVGIVSFGNGGGNGCEAGWPAGHSRVSAYHDWISARL